MSKINQSEIADLCGIDRETAKRHLEGHKWEAGPGKSKLYESADVLIIRPAGGDDGEALTQAEATRQLTVKRGQQIDLEMEVTRKDRWPKPDVEEIHDAALSNVAGLIKAHEGKTLDVTLIGDIFTELRSVGERLARL